MAGSAHGGSSEAAAPEESLAAAPEPVRLLLPSMVDAVAAVAAARTEPDVAAACLPALVALPGVRAAAVVQRQGRSAVVLASLGYDCGAMAAGTALPLEAGLPVTEAVRTGRTVVQGTDLPADLERAADRVLASASAVGAAHDDVSLLLVRARTS